MPPLIPRLAEICREQLLREKILVAPSLAIGHQIADAVAGFAIASDGLTVLSHAQALALIELPPRR
ncbi:MAG TPA: hypothetical protein VLU46_06890 [Thermoanaerobaculia bacterium]|nr:hypothetical protein [Thermoanaerobaculia bacterium]